MFPPVYGVSITLSPRIWVTSLHVTYGKYLRIDVGTYTQVHKECDNSMRSKTNGNIALHTTGNTKEGCYFLSLTTIHHIYSRSGTKPLKSQTVIDQAGYLVDLARRVYTPCHIKYMTRDQVSLISDNTLDGVLTAGFKRMTIHDIEIYGDLSFDNGYKPSGKKRRG